MKVSAILDSIELGNMALPEFQRGYVWGRGQVRSLMQSLYRRYPVGSLLVWKTQAGSASTRGTSHDESKVIDLLLDGQQRMTSLYGVLRGRAPTFFQGDPKAFTDMYFDLRTEVFEFYGPVKMKDDPLWVNVTELFKTGLGPWFGVATELGLDAETQALYLERLNTITSITDIDFHLEQITGEKDVDEVVEIFNKVNSGGTKLSKGDLALATLCGQWPGARTELRRMIAKWEEAGFRFDLEWLLRCATAIATNQAQFTALRAVPVDDFATALASAEKSIDFLLNLISSRLGLDHDRVLGGRYAFTALSRFVHQNGDQVLSPEEQGKLLYWYAHSMMWGRYSGSTETMLARDLEALTDGGIDAMIAELERWRGELIVRPADFDTSTVGSRFYPVLYMLSRVGGAKDLVSGLELSQSMLGSSSSLELHHIFPKARLYEAEYEKNQVNAVANFCFLTAGSNKSISAKDPGVYLAEIDSEHPSALPSQWISSDRSLWSIDKYPDFLAARRELLANATNMLLQDLIAGSEIGQTPGASLGPSVAPVHEVDSQLTAISEMMEGLGLARPVLNHEIVDDHSGEVLAIADAVWPQGVQVGRTQPLAFLLAPDETMELRLGELGYRFFTERRKLDWYIEEVTGVDIDGDGHVGEVEV